MAAVFFRSVSSPTGFGPAGRAADFVQVRDGAFRLAGRRFRFCGTNNYYLHYKSQRMTDSVLTDAAALGLRVVRCWGFLDGTPADGVVLQPEPFRYDEDGFEPLDHAVFRAGQLGLRLVIALTNNWSDFGGIPRYATWFSAEHDDFFHRHAIRECYRAWVTHVISRRNRYTGVPYNHEPAVMTWELANEPRCPSDPSGDTLVAWADEMSRYVRQLAPRQLVAVGDEGFHGRADTADYPASNQEGVVWHRLLRLPGIDYGTFHLHPQQWGEKSPGWGVRWIHDHFREAAVAGVPAVLEEFSWQDDGIARDTVYAAWTAAVEDADGDGDQFWLLTGRNDDGSHYPDYDGRRVIHPSATAALFAGHAGRMSRPGREFPSRPA
ncbi:cellulase family glycosylhydrolase [Protofrankia sp. BMG5.30]|uniref:glycoside hydrolase 5 family protein n=1 Tax=Protofrankia sp. BMG5.30 TaxID=1834514 RepID=UPI0020CA8960|nr:cellulase family glycosylhydrolase [Protofrankia sp. BMG5.30]